MTLQASGAITLAQVQTEFGGANPVSMSEDYRGGANVPTTVGGAAGAWSAYFTNTTTHYWSVEASQIIRWASVNVYNGVTTATIFTVGSYDYERGPLHTTVPGGKAEPDLLYYQVRRRTTATSETVNTGIPSSGTIDMADFYGGRNS